MRSRLPRRPRGVVTPQATIRPDTHGSGACRGSPRLIPEYYSPWRDDPSRAAAYPENVQFKMAVTAAIRRARQAAGPAWRALIQLAAGPDPRPAGRWGSPWQRRAAACGLAVATAAATAASVVALLDAKALIAVPHGPAQQAVPAQSLPQYQVVSAFQGRSPWMMALIILVPLAGVAPLPLAIHRPLLGWRIGWLTLLAVPWTGIHWLPEGGPLLGNWPWNPVQVAVLAVVFVAAGIRHRRSVLWLMWALTLLPWWLQAGHARPGLTVLGLGTILFTAAAVAADALGGRSRARLALAGAAERAEAEAARRAVLEERARIARELHDVVAHHLSLIAVRAEAAPYRLTTLPDDARTEFGELCGTAREALAEMRRLLGVLRTGQTAEHAPQPQLGDLPGLVDAARDAGLAVEFSQRGPLDRLPAAVGVCAYRMVQESLSNAGRHAPGAAISVAVDVEPPVVRLKISNGPAAARNGAPVRTTTANGSGPGHGLAGMRERVTLLGGTFAAGPAPGGGFEVAAELPAGEPA
jgi:signal transduction histidine kinase